MKMLALRLREVGPFVEPIALEGFSGGLDVLTGPNETGKSTLFTALGTLLAERHTSTARAIAALRPETGGAPLIEADIEIGGRTLRLRKRYLAQRMAQLQDLQSGQIWHGADAETAAEQLLGGEARRALRGLLWVAQGASFSLPEKPDAALSAGLAAFIEHEAADAAGAGHLRRLALAVRERLETLVTIKQGKARAGGPLDIARRRRDEIAQRLEVQRGKAVAAEARLEQRNALRAELARLVDPRTLEQMSAATAAARKALDDADKARDLLKLASERARAQQLAFEQARSSREQVTLNAAEAGRVDNACIDGTARLLTLNAQRSAIDVRMSSALAAVDSMEREFKEARRQLHDAHAARQRAAAQAQLAELDRCMAQAREAERDVAEADARLAGHAVTEAAVETIRALTSQLAVLDHRIADETAQVTVTYLPGVTARIFAEGQHVADGLPFAIHRKIDLVIDGIGKITIDPGQARHDTALDARERCERELTAVLASLTVTDLASAQAELAARRLDEATSANGRTRLHTLAPVGIAALAELRADAAHRAGPPATAVETTGIWLEALEQRITIIEQKLAAERASVVTIENELKAIAAVITRLDTENAANRRRAGELAVLLPPVEVREAELQRLSKVLGEANASLDATVRERSAWADVAPQGPAYQTLQNEVQRTTQDLERLNNRRQQLDRDIAELEGALSRDNEDGVVAEVTGLEEELAAAESRVGDLETDADALSLIALKLDQIGADHRDQVLRPLVERLRPLIGRLFPDARLAMQGPLLAARLDRPNRSDPVERVSAGTREQIATLVRIAYAELLSARGVSLPLVLDDALVYADDRRLETMIELLAEAARRHQVIVLSCHQLAFEPLAKAHGASMLAIEPWREIDSAMVEGSSPRAPRRRSMPATPGSIQ